MLTILHLANSRSDRLIWLLEELGLDYEIEAHARDPETGRSGAAFRVHHPYAKAPMLRDGDTVLIDRLGGSFLARPRQQPGSLFPRRLSVPRTRPPRSSWSG